MHINIEDYNFFLHFYLLQGTVQRQTFVNANVVISKLTIPAFQRVHLDVSMVFVQTQAFVLVILATS